MNAAALPFGRTRQTQHQFLPEKKSNLRAVKSDDKEVMLQPFRDLASAIVEMGQFKLSGERELSEGNKSLLFLRNTREDLHIKGEPVKEYLLIVASHESSGKSFLATYHIPENRGNRYCHKLQALFAQQLGPAELQQQALRTIRNYESGRRDLYQLLHAFSTVRADEELVEEVRHEVVRYLQQTLRNKPTLSGKGIVTQINALDNVMSVCRHSRHHTLKTLFDSITTFSTYHLDTREPAQAEGLGADLNQHIFHLLEREWQAELAEIHP